MFDQLERPILFYTSWQENFICRQTALIKEKKISQWKKEFLSNLLIFELVFNIRIF